MSARIQCFEVKVICFSSCKLMPECHFSNYCPLFPER